MPATLQFAFILYPTVTSTGNIVYDQSDNTWHLPVASSQNNITINTQFSNIEVGDYVILDWGKKRNLRKYLLSLGWKEWSGDYNRENEWNFRWK